ncbi:putative membrane protein [Streptacidiphilus sp. MAP12-33]|uniref:histidine kinase n=1 Tax=Streptacidiphilus sp. MAP12-33 TaxID=3156266 RepID=UPI003517AE68
MKDMSSDMENDDKVLFFTLTDRAKADAAFADVTELPTVTRAALLERDTDGKVTVPQDYDPRAGGAMVGFGAVGTVLGLFIGPLGAAIGIALGAGLGVLADGEEAEVGTDALIGLTAWVDPGTCLLVAEMVESDPRAVDTIAKRNEAKLQRVPAAEAAEWLDQLRTKVQSETDSGPGKGGIAL